MFDLYTHGTPNGYKATIALEELGFAYDAHTVDPRGGLTDLKLLRMNPNAKIPILYDQETDTSVYESGAILLYLANKSGRLFPGTDSPKDYADGLQKLFFASAWLGPMFGQRMQYAFFTEETVPHAIRRYENEGRRTTEVAQTMLGHQEWFLDWGYSVVDIALFCWLEVAKKAGYVPEDEFGPLLAWMDRMRARPAVAKGLTVPVDRSKMPLPPRKTVA